MKNFKSEYQGMIQEEMPDLWGRIEASLAEKPVGPATEQEIQPATGKTIQQATGQVIQQETEQTIEQTKKTNAGIRKWRFARYSGLVAACLCGVIVLPAIVLVWNGTAGSAERASEETASAEAPAAVYEEAEMAAYEEAPAAAYEEAPAAVYEETPAEAGETTEAVDASAAEEMKAATEMAACEDSAANEMSTDIYMKETAEAEMAEVEMATAKKASDESVSQEVFSSGTGTVIENIKVCIVQTEQLKYHTVYHAVIETDESGLFQTGEEIEFMAADDADGMFDVNGTYTITLQYVTDAEICWRLKKD